jgi:hypothetical protein
MLVAVTEMVVMMMMMMMMIMIMTAQSRVIR